MPNAVCAQLANRKDLGLHTELMTPSVAALIKSGAVTNKYKAVHRHKNVYTLAEGDREFYEYLDNNSCMELYAVDFVNDPYVIGQNDRVVSISGFLEVGLDGEVNAGRSDQNSIARLAGNWISCVALNCRRAANRS